MSHRYWKSPFEKGIFQYIPTKNKFCDYPAFWMFCVKANISLKMCMGFLDNFHTSPFPGMIIASANSAFNTPKKNVLSLSAGIAEAREYSTK